MLKQKGFITYNMAIIILILVFLAYIAYRYSFIKNAIEKFTCRQIKAKLQTAIDSYRGENEGMFSQLGRIYKPVKVYKLYKDGLLENYYDCPSGGEYRFREDGTVYCTVHDIEEERKY